MNSIQYCDFAKVYDILMNDVDYNSWAEYAVKLIKKYAPDTKRIAECACGTGNLTILLKKYGYDITGFDISRGMLEEASEKARNNGLMIPFIQMDMTKLELHRPCDCIIAACDGVNYLTSQSDVFSFFSSAYKNLKAGGALMFDISSEYKLREILGINTFAETQEKCSYIWKNMYDEQSKLIEMNLSFFVKENDLYRRFDERHIQMAHDEKDIINLLKKAGFNTAMSFNAFTMDAPNDISERIQFVAIK